MKKIQITLKQLFEALPEKYKFITCDKEICFDPKNVQRYINTWQFQPTLGKRFGRSIDEWQGMIKTNEELGFNFDLYEENPETSHTLQTHFIWEIVEFKDKDTKDCFAKREDYILDN